MMNKYIIKARKSVFDARHMLKTTYAVTKEPKILLVIAGDLYYSVFELIKQITDSASDEFGVVFSEFKEFIKNKDLDVDPSFLEELYNIVLEHQNSPVEFERDNSLIICDAKYSCTRLSSELVNRYLFKSSKFINYLEQVL